MPSVVTLGEKSVCKITLLITVAARLPTPYPTNTNTGGWPDTPARMLLLPHNPPHATSTTHCHPGVSSTCCSRVASVRQHKVHSIQPSPFKPSLQLPRAQAASAAAQQHETAASSDGGGDASILETADTDSSITTTKGPAEEVWEYEAPQHVQQRNAEFVEQQLRGRVILAPLTKGGNLPFRCE